MCTKRRKLVQDQSCCQELVRQKVLGVECPSKGWPYVTCPSGSPLHYTIHVLNYVRNDFFSHIILNLEIVT